MPVSLIFHVILIALFVLQELKRKLMDHALHAQLDAQLVLVEFVLNVSLDYS